MPWFLILIAVVLSGLRVAGHTSETYQAAAHLYVGALLGSAWSQGPWEPERATTKYWIAGVLIFVEVTCFLTFKLLR